MWISRFQSAICPLSPVLCPLSSVLCPLSSVLCPLSSVLCPLSSVVRLLIAAPRIARVIDHEQVRIGFFRRVEIEDRNGGVEPLRIGDGPLLELQILGVEHDQQ